MLTLVAAYGQTYLLQEFNQILKSVSLILILSCFLVKPYLPV